MNKTLLFCFSLNEVRVRPPQEFLDKLGNQPSGLLERSQGQLPDIQEGSQDASPGLQERSEARLLPPKKYRYLLEVKLPYDPHVHLSVG